MSNESKFTDNDILKYIFIFIGAIWILTSVYFYSEKEKYGYEIVIIDKYTDIGSNFHIIGGRASETEYHVTYKWKYAKSDEPYTEYTTTVESSKYRSLQIGQKIIQRDKNI